MTTPITQLAPIDVSGVRDSGMQALIVLAHSLGWNVRQKQNQPVVITARDGFQKRLPTNTSIRISVFQTALSSIFTHSEEEVPTIELMDALISQFKLDADHARRIRMAVGESPTQHRERVAAAEAQWLGPREPQPVTQRIEVPEDFGISFEENENNIAARAALDEPTCPPADGRFHGTLLRTEPFLAAKTGSKKPDGTGAFQYVSKALEQREWEDGYVDYLCTACRDYAVASPRAIGSHRAIHIAKGEAEPTNQARQSREARARAKGRAAAVEVEWEEPGPTAKHVPAPLVEGPSVLDQIRALVVPELIEELRVLRIQTEVLTAANEALTRDWGALKDLIGGR